MAMMTENSAILLFRFSYHFSYRLGKVGFFGSAVPLSQSAHEPNDQTDKHHGSD